MISAFICKFWCGLGDKTKEKGKVETNECKTQWEAGEGIEGILGVFTIGRQGYWAGQ